LGAGLFLDFDKFQPVSPRIFRIEPALTRQIVIIRRGHSTAGQRFAQVIQVENGKRGVSLLGWPEITFDANVQWLRAALEPAPSRARRTEGFSISFKPRTAP
jgi:hypothetical protein